MGIGNVVICRSAGGLKQLTRDAKCLHVVTRNPILMDCQKILFNVYIPQKTSTKIMPALRIEITHYNGTEMAPPKYVSFIMEKKMSLHFTPKTMSVVKTKLDSCHKTSK